MAEMNDIVIAYSNEIPKEGKAPDAWIHYLRSLQDRSIRLVKAIVDRYDGDVGSLAKTLGVTPATVSRYLQQPVVRYMIQERKPSLEIEGQIASREERQAFWTSIMRDGQHELKERLKAAELLGRSQCDFTDKVEVKGEIHTLHELVKSLREEPPPRLPEPHAAALPVQALEKLPAPAEDPLA